MAAWSMSSMGAPNCWAAVGRTPFGMAMALLLVGDDRRLGKYRTQPSEPSAFPWISAATARLPQRAASLTPHLAIWPGQGRAFLNDGFCDI